MLKRALVLLALFPLSIASAADLTATKVIKYTPTGGGQNMKEGYCWTNSIAAPRPDAWRCMVGNEIYDPCFESSKNSIQCNPNPAKGDDGFRLKLNKPLPKPDVSPDAMSQKGGWLVELNDGTICSPATGARGLVDGRMITYYCENKLIGTDIVLLDELNSSSSTWTADKATLVPGPGGEKLLKVEKVPVKVVWQ